MTAVQFHVERPTVHAAATAEAIPYEPTAADLGGLNVLVLLVVSWCVWWGVMSALTLPFWLAARRRRQFCPACESTLSNERWATVTS